MVINIVIPVFNAPDLLRTCYQTLLGVTQYSGACNIVWVDNGSTHPQTLEILESLENAHCNTVIHNESPMGFAATVNKGIAQHQADMYVLFNQDCKVTDPQWLTTLTTWMEDHPACGICGPKLLFPDGRVQQAGITFHPGTIGVHRLAGAPGDYPEANLPAKQQAVTGAVFCVRGTMLKSIGPMDEAYMFGCEDSEYCLRAQCLGWEVWYVPLTSVVHHEGGVRRDSNTNPLRLMDWIGRSEHKFRTEWGTYIDLCLGDPKMHSQVITSMLHGR